ncbi:type II toxin-antitoxin system RelE/ParE family toxin [Alicyclobacillus fodiniaquatilis]|uniref:Type II toxin-antitoxin system RelE/ParE family toxin n=1 Tax=Alicyclobacillus fodiniaquatilis TaxID=1661150 RepID=A0ABW4JLB5_9BACL
MREGGSSYDIVLYEDDRGNSEIADFLAQVAEDAAAGKKDAVTLKKQIDLNLELLKQAGTRIGKPYVDHIDGPIWELRPGRYRVLFVGWNGSHFVLLHHFMKSTQKTPRREIEKAKREYSQWVKSHGQ